MKYSFFLIFFYFCFCSCTPYKQVPYFTDLPQQGKVIEDISNFAQLKIKRSDILAITVSSLNNEASAIFNMGNTSSMPNAVGSDPRITANGFIVGDDGTIQLPLIGSVKVEGLSTLEARQVIQTRLDTSRYLKQPVVNLRISNFRISVLGDVSRPGVYQVDNEQVSVAEALGMAGDLTITAKRNNVLLVRETGGKREMVRLNMQSKELFNSPYYYLQNNDVLYVQPGNAKYAGADVSYRNITVALSVISVLALFITRF